MHEHRAVHVGHAVLAGRADRACPRTRRGRGCPTTSRSAPLEASTRAECRVTAHQPGLHLRCLDVQPSSFRQWRSRAPLANVHLGVEVHRGSGPGPAVACRPFPGHDDPQRAGREDGLADGPGRGRRARTASRRSRRRSCPCFPWVRLCGHCSAPFMVAFGLAGSYGPGAVHLVAVICKGGDRTAVSLSSPRCGPGAGLPQSSTPAPTSTSVAPSNGCRCPSAVAAPGPGVPVVASGAPPRICHTFRFNSGRWPSSPWRTTEPPCPAVTSSHPLPGCGSVGTEGCRYPGGPEVPSSSGFPAWVPSRRGNNPELENGDRGGWPPFSKHRLSGRGGCPRHSGCAPPVRVEPKVMDCPSTAGCQQ